MIVWHSLSLVSRRQQAMGEVNLGIQVGGVTSVEDRWLTNTGMVTLEGSPSAGWTFLRWHGEPLGGTALPDVTAHDVTGAPVREAVTENRAAG